MRLGRSSIAVLCVAVVSQGLLVGCNGSGSSAAVRTRDGGAVQHQLTDKDNGATVAVHVGDGVTVTLHSTYWQLGSPEGDGQVLVQRTPPSPTASPSPCPVAGAGCGTVVADYLVGAAGTVRLTAHRDSCGEALRCTAGQGDWSVKVVATS